MECIQSYGCKHKNREGRWSVRQTNGAKYKWLQHDWFTLWTLCNNVHSTFLATGLHTVYASNTERTMFHCVLYVLVRSAAQDLSTKYKMQIQNTHTKYKYKCLVVLLAQWFIWEVWHKVESGEVRYTLQAMSYSGQNEDNLISADG